MKRKEKSMDRGAAKGAKRKAVPNVRTNRDKTLAKARWTAAYKFVCHKTSEARAKRLLVDDTTSKRNVEAGYLIGDFTKFTDQITTIFNKCKDNTDGKVADYIPELSKYAADNWGLSICTVDGQTFSIGNVDTPFPIQSCCKPLNYAVAQKEKKASEVHKYVGMEPSGRLFNDMALNHENKPYNPMVNAGAIVVSSLVKDKIKDQDERLKAMMEEYRQMAGHGHVGFNEDCFVGEKRTAYRNYSIGYMLLEKKVFPLASVFDETMDLYFKLCSIEITAQSGAVMAGTLANGGFCPTTREKVLKVPAVMNTLSLMFSCGMYDYSGQFAFKVGLPAKSGVSGVVMLVIPNVMGICMWSPPLDHYGNSVRGIQFCEEFIKKFSFHHFADLLHNCVQEDPCLRSCVEDNQNALLLMTATKEGDIKQLKRLSSIGVRMGQTDYDSRTALHLAAAEGHLPVVKFLMETCNVPRDPKDRWGRTPRDDAVFGKHNTVVAYLDNAKP